MYQCLMKKQLILTAIIALGAVVLSCEDSSYDEVEQTVLEDQTTDPTDADEQIETKPGSNSN